MRRLEIERLTLLLSWLVLGYVGMGKVDENGEKSKLHDMHLIFSVSGEEVDNDIRLCNAISGNINGDNYDDLIIGAIDTLSGYTKIYIYLGGEQIDTIPYIKFQAKKSLEAGAPMSCGDVNGDGFDDVIVGAPLSGTPMGAGELLVYFRGNPMDTTADLIFHSPIPQYQGHFGISISTEGDLNNDGCDDLIVGHPETIAQDSPGQVYVYFGAASMDTIPDCIIIGGDTVIDSSMWGEKLGNKVYIVGDVNSDNYDDFIVGSGDGFFNRFFLYFGSVTIDTTNKIMFHREGPPNAGLIGWPVGDVNGDNFSDIAAGFDLDSLVFIYYGSILADTISDFTLNIGHMGSSNRVGDINQDGYEDISIGVYPPWPQLNEVDIYLGGSPIDTILDAIIMEENVNDDMGILAGGDINSDGYDDIIVTAPRYGWTTSGKRIGKVYIYSWVNWEVEELHSDEQFIITSLIPNPFNHSIGISYKINLSFDVSIKIYDITGKLVKVLVNEKQKPGTHCICWNGKDEKRKKVRSGVYFFKIVGKKEKEVVFNSVNKVILVR